jgi:hypothetical protein
VSYVPLEAKVVDLLADQCSTISLLEYGYEDEVTVLRRPIGSSDPNLSIGIYLANWEPLEGPSIGMHEQDLCRYNYGIQTMCKVDERESGLRISSILTKKLRRALVRDEAFRVQLQQLREDEDDFTLYERVLRFKFERLSYDDMAVNGGGFLYISASVFSVETETVS